MLKESVTMFAHAKVNLALAITGWHEGFHQLETIMQSIETHDVIEVKHQGTGINCECGSLSGSENLAYKAAGIFLQSLGKPEGIDIRITKHIPLEAGLAGGSSDAAAVILALNRMFSEPFSLAELERMALLCGSDVPFCLSGGTKFAVGRGERMEDLPDAPRLDLVIVKPQQGVSTAEAYRRFAGRPIYRHLERERWQTALANGNKEEIAGLLSNDLENVSEALVPEITQAKNLLREAGCLGVLMSGSGSAVFGITGDAEQAQFVAERMQQQGFYSWVTRSVGQEEIGKG